MSSRPRVVPLRPAPEPRATPAAAPAHRDGLLVAIARALEAGRHGLTWENAAALWSAAYFSWHSEEVDEFGRDAKFTETIRPLLEFLYTVWWRVEPAGVENVPAEGPALVVANHSGVLPWDGAMISLAVRHEHPARRECRMLALDMFALLPFLAPALARTGAVRASQENGERLLRAGELVGVFPEGVKGVGKRYRDRYKLARFGRGGFVRLALRTSAPIVPCAVVGAEEIHPVLAKADWVGRPFGLPYFPITPSFPLLGPLGVVPLPTKWSIEFADPVPTTAYGPEGADDPILVNRLSEQVRSIIQRMIDGRLARRRSIWFG
ncbi:MAG TPA: lysophospholipid acyltransferase family protein [Vicinamibacteria bacterium]